MPFIDVCEEGFLGFKDAIFENYGSCKKSSVLGSLEFKGWEDRASPD
jgi:hypothetical protein